MIKFQMPNNFKFLIDLLLKYKDSIKWINTYLEIKFIKKNKIHQMKTDLDNKEFLQFIQIIGGYKITNFKNNFPGIKLKNFTKNLKLRTQHIL